ncbi:MAG: sensor histidine kinase [Anaerovoracaceae bacterium]|jgi:signal transduction histidine kinase
MKGLSIKKRVMLWYAFTMLVVITLVIVLLLAAGDKLIRDDAKSNLTAATDRAVNDVQVIDSKLAIDDDMVYYLDGAYVVIYKNDGMIISGLPPDGFPGNVSFKADEIRKVVRGDKPFYVYDRLIENQQLGKTWIRGITSASLKDSAPSIWLMIKMFLIALPLLLGLALLGGWYITKRAFMPLKDIADTAEQIQEGSDLSRRLGFEKMGDRDEISRTAATFDMMLDRIEESFEMEKRFTNDASHELRTPAAVIMAQCEYALDNLDDPRDVEESLRVILAESRKMTTLIKQLLTLARADRGVQQLDMTRTDIGLTAEEAVSNFSSKAAEYGVEMAIDAEEGLYTMGDPVFLSRMFENLISNAIKYNHSGGHVWLSVKSGEEGIRISVNDDGNGISAEDLTHIWERFYRAHSAPGGRNRRSEREAEQQSTGLGLPLVKWIVEAHHGRISVRSAPGSGTEFVIFLPPA